MLGITQKAFDAIDVITFGISSVLAFVEEYCAVEDWETLREELYNAYLEYCNTGGQKPVSQKRFNSDLEGISSLERGLEAMTRRKTWCGIRLL